MANYTTAFNVNVLDLQYILKQIKIAEDTSIGYTPLSAPKTIIQSIMDAYGVTAANAAQLPAGLRTVDGTFNNLIAGQSGFGAADTLFPRLTAPVFDTVDGPGIDFNGDGIIDVINHAYGDASAAPGTQIRSVADTDPRIISNLIVDMSVNNPAAIAAWFNNPLSVEAWEAAHLATEVPVAPADIATPALLAAWNIAHPGQTAVALTNTDLADIPNQSPDIGLSPGFNSWMTYFGQFFDHGLDLVTKGSNGTVYIPLAVDDPLYDKGADGIANNITDAYFVTDPALTLVGQPKVSGVVTAWQAFYATDPADRASYPLGAFAPAMSTTSSAWVVRINDDGAGADGIFSTADDRPNFMALSRATVTLDANGVPQHQNTTTSWIDQNQTYTSHASHQVFLREYVMTPTGAVATGKLIDGAVAGTIGNWAEVKAQALTMLGIILTDFDVHNIPQLMVDQYGKFIPGPNGYAQVATLTGFIEGTATGLALPANTVRTNSAFLNDISHHASPGKFDSNGDGFKESNQTADNDMLDANGDGLSNADDVAYLNGGALTYLGKRLTDANGDAIIDAADLADVNLDGVINAADTVADDHNARTYDDEMLNAHFITGDGRGNENIALTAVHSIFHSEHNRLVDANKVTLLKDGNLAFLNEWLVTDVGAMPVIPVNATDAQVLAIASTLVWDGERLFQAARFSTEMQYQHLVFEEFARRIQPNVDPFIFNSVTEINPSIVAEFAHTVYRFGHSMLTGTVDRLGNDLNPLGASQETLLAAFLNPQMYLAGGATAAEINANLIRGLSRDVGNEMDEFIVSDVRSSLLGLPLDLAALNIARGRDTGIPSLNETRAQLYNGGAIDLKPYISWVDFSEHLKNPLSIVNFIAAYGTHASILAATDVAGKRAAASALVDQAILNDNTTSGAIDFLNATGAYAGGSLGGLNDVDLWIGGLAEAKNEFGGMLGQTFNFIFEYQMEALQFGDRLYYLTRTQGTNFLNQLEPNTFSDLVMRNTDLGNIYSTHLNGALFVTPDHYFEMDTGIAQEDYNGAAAGRDVSWAVGEPHSALLSKVTRTVSGVQVLDAATGIMHDVGGTFKFLGGEHVVVGGTEGNDKIWTDKGIDTLWGDGGNDYLNAGTESDDVFGGEGDDIIEDPFGDDVLRGNQGNDVISSARGIDLLFGDEGNDFIMLGQDASEIFGGEGDDFILGGGGKDFLLGNEGNDWIEGGAGFDTIAGDNSELFFNSPVIGHDVLFNQGDEGDYDAESGDDIMGSGPSVFRYEGMFGFDWAIAKNDISGVSFDMAIPIFTTVVNDILKDRFDQVEALSGWKFNDILEGDDRGHKGGGSSAPDSVPTELFAEHLLTQEGINRINGFNEWFGGNANGTMDGTDARITLFGGASPVPGSTPVSTFRDGNILMGGDGNDLFRGRGGYDLIDGDAWLNVRIKIVHNGVTYSAESLSSDTTVMGQYAGKVFNTYTAADALVNPLNIAGSPNFASPAFGSASLSSLMLTGVINPGSLSIVREILTDNTNVTGAGQNIDTVLFQGTMAEYEIEGLQTDGINYTGQVLRQAQDLDGDGFIFVRDKDTGAVGAVIQGLDANGNVIDVQLPSSRGLLTDDRDLLKNIEQLQFADRSFLIGGPNIQATGIVTIADPTPFDGRVTPYVGQLLPVSSVLYDRDNDANGDGDLLDIGDTAITNVTYEWQTTEVGNDAGWSTITTNANPYLVRGVDPGHILRAVATFTDKNGVTERVYSAATDNPTASFSVNENSLTGVVVGLQIPFNVDYDSQSIGGNPPPDVDLARLHHEIDPTNNAGGRFTVVLNGVDFNGNPRYSLVVANGGPVLLDYEALQTPVDNQFQVVVNTYDAPGGTLVAVRQFTILLNDVVNESAPVVYVPTDINWNGVRPSDTALPLDGVVIANLSTVDVDSSPVTWSQIGGDARFTVTAAGNVSFTDPTAVNGLSADQVYTLILKAEETANPSAAVTEAITIRTGTTGNNNGTFGLAALIGSGLTDIIYGLNGNDILNGLGGNDTLFGQGGTDTLNGGVGNDEMIGGTGNDIVNGGDGNDTILYAIGDGSDNVDGGADSDKLVITGTTGDDRLDVVFNGTSLTNFEGGTIVNVESVSADLGADTGVGSKDYLDYNGSTAAVTVNLGTGTASGFASIAGIEQVRGGDGNDTFTGGDAGGDFNTLIGNDGNDTFFINDAADIVSESFGTDGGIDLVNATVSYTITDADVENLTLLGTADINGTGNASANVLTGNSGNNILNGAGGVDTASYANATAGVTVSLTTVGAQNTVGAGTDTLISIENLTGSTQADTLTGNTVANVLSGGGGNDTLVATTDNVRDTLDGGAGSDTADYSTSTAGLTVNLGGTAPIVVGGTGATVATSDVIVSVENITTGSGADTISGSNAVNTLNGGAGVDIINGEGGADIIVGGAGTDTISGGTGQDTLTGGADKDTFVYATVAEASTSATNFDIITDFVTAGASSDIIDLSAIDAIQGLASPGNQAFTFINSGIFTAPGQLRYVVSLGNTFIEGNVGGSTAADFRIQLSGVTTALGVEDFVL